MSLPHLEIVGSIIVMLNKGAKGQLAKGVEEEGELYRAINGAGDPGVKEALGFLMTREIAHQLSFEKALHAIQPNFPQGKLPGMPEFTNKYFNMSGEPNVRGPWNEGAEWEYVENPEPAVDGGDGLASVTLGAADLDVLEAMKTRTMSDPTSNPVTGADLGSGLVQGKDA